MNNYFDNRPSAGNDNAENSIKNENVNAQSFHDAVPEAETVSAEVKEVNDAPTSILNNDQASSEAEHVISFREDDTEPNSTSYHLTGDNLVKDEMTMSGDFFRPEPQRESFPNYGSPKFDGNGNVSYSPAPEKKKKSGAAGRVALVILCMFLSFACGVGGAMTFNFVAGGSVVSEGDSGKNGKDKNSVDNTVIVQRPAEHVETSSDGSELTYADVEAMVGDSVVAITTEYKVVSYWQEYVTGGAGSGVVMSEEGHIITNYHVVAATNSYNEYADAVKISFKNGKEYDAEIIGGDPEMDIAVLKIELDEGDELTPAVFADSDKLKVGEEVIAIGNPLGELSGTTTNGIISALAREVVIEDVKMNLLQTNAAINPGNSGGGLFNMNGELIGVVNAKSSGTGIEGLGFAIPSNDALETATDIIENGGNVTKVANVKVGISVITISTLADAQQYGVNAFGVYVDKVEEGFNDDVLESGDRIIAVDGQEIATGDDVVQIVRDSEAGDVLEFIVYRIGRVKTVDVTVYENPEAK